jgi:hypothetical protein
MQQKWRIKEDIPETQRLRYHNRLLTKSLSAFAVLFCFDARCFLLIECASILQEKSYIP